MILKALLLLGCGAGVWAADVTGKWKLVYVTANGLQREAMLELKTEENKLVGSLSSERGTARIDAGTVKQDEISFSLLRKSNGDEIEVEYKGKIEDGVLKLTMRFRNREWVAVTGRRM
jgi:hypothetical protein